MKLNFINSLSNISLWNKVSIILLLCGFITGLFIYWHGTKETLPLVKTVPVRITPTSTVQTSLPNAATLFLHPTETIIKSPPKKSAPAPQKPTSTITKKNTNNKLDKTQHVIVVLNGAGGIGTAAQAKEFLDTEGFIVVNIHDATNFNYQNTIVQARKGISAIFLNALKSALAKKYKINNEIQTTDTDYITVIIGKTKK